MVTDWLIQAMKDYNSASLIQKDSYSGVIMLPGPLLQKILGWTLQSLPDEILIGLDYNGENPHIPEVEHAFLGMEAREDLFSGQGYIIEQAQIVNRGDSFSVHHLPEEWTDPIYQDARGPRAGRFAHWLHTHPNAPALPSGPDADAAQSTEGVDMILGVEFSPTGPLPFYDDIEGKRRRLVGKVGKLTPKQGDQGAWRRRVNKPVLGKASTGHDIHGIELISFHRSGVGINVILVDDDGYPYGWPFNNDDED